MNLLNKFTKMKDYMTCVRLLIGNVGLDFSEKI